MSYQIYTQATGKRIHIQQLSYSIICSCFFILAYVRTRTNAIHNHDENTPNRHAVVWAAVDFISPYLVLPTINHVIRAMPTCCKPYSKYFYV